MLVRIGPDFAEIIAMRNLVRQQYRCVKLR